MTRPTSRITTARTTTRAVLLAVATLAASTTALTSAYAQSGDKPMVRVLVGFPPGVGTDNLARMYAEALADALPISTMVDNRPGAGGQIAAQALKQATPQSNSILFAVDHQIVMLPLVTKNPGFDVKKDMVPVGRIVNFYTCLTVPGDSPIKDLPGFIEAVKKSPLQGNVAVPAPGSQPHFLTYTLSQKYGVELNAVPYKGWAPAIIDLVGNNVPAGIGPCDALTEYKKTNRVRVLAVASEQRYKAMPDVPTFAEYGMKMPADSFLGVYASTTLKPELLKQITDATQKMFDSPKTVAKFATTQMEPAYAGPEELRSIVDKNTVFWSEQVRKSNFQAQ